MRRRAFLAGLAAAGLGCKGDVKVGNVTGPTAPVAGDTDDGEPAAGTPRAPSPIGYSEVNSMDGAQARLLVDAGLTLAASDNPPLGDLSRWAPRALREAADVMRAAGGVLFITLSNWNWPAATAEPEAAYRRRVQDVIDVVGPDGVWLQGVSEGDGSERAVERQLYVAERWPGTVVANARGTIGTAHLRGADIVDWHVCRLEEVLPSLAVPGRLTSTDCTPVLGSRLSQADVTRFTRAAAERRARFLIYDTFTGSPNRTVIRWMGDALRA